MYNDAPGKNHWRPLRAGLVVVSALGGQVVFAAINMLLSPPPPAPGPPFTRVEAVIITMSLMSDGRFAEYVQAVVTCLHPRWVKLSFVPFFVNLT